MRGRRKEGGVRRERERERKGERGTGGTHEEDPVHVVLRERRGTEVSLDLEREEGNILTPA